MHRSLPCLLALALWGLLLAAPGAPARAQALGAAEDVISVALRPGWREADGRHVAALDVRLRPGWKTYWRAAGSLGISPRLDWRGSGNLAAASPAWPTPEAFREAGGLSIGYDRDFVLPIVVRPVDPAAPVRLRLSVDLGVCEAICVPARVAVEGVLPPRGADDPAIRAALRDRPRRAGGAARCRLAPEGGALALTAEMELPRLAADEVVVFEPAEPGTWAGDAAVTRHGGRLSATTRLSARGGAPAALDRGRLRITVLGGGRGVEFAGCAGG